MPVFYTLPKIHKRLVDPPQTNSLLSPLSQYVDYFIKPFVQKWPFYIRDSTDFINKISVLWDLPDTVLLLTLDISSLYTNITHEKGLNALRYYLAERDKALFPPSYFLVEMASYVLKYNYFSFDNDFYLQSERHGDGFDFCPKLCKFIHWPFRALLYLQLWR